MHLLNGIKSVYFNCGKGVRPGENLPPLLFFVYLNDLENFLLSNNCEGVEIAIDDDNIELYITNLWKTIIWNDSIQILKTRLGFIESVNER